MTVVLFDLDDTLIDGKVIDNIALRYGFLYDLNRLRTNLKMGMISHEDLTRHIIKLMVGFRANRIVSYAKDIPLMLNSNKMLGQLKRDGCILGIISDEMKFITDSYMDRFGLHYSFGHLAEVEEGKLTGRLQFARSECKYMDWKKEVTKEIKDKTDLKVIAIGAEDIDAPMFREADLGIAFNATSNAKRAADIVVDRNDCEDILKIISDFDSS